MWWAYILLLRFRFLQLELHSAVTRQEHSIILNAYIFTANCFFANCIDKTSYFVAVAKKFDIFVTVSAEILQCMGFDEP